MEFSTLEEYGKVAKEAKDSGVVFALGGFKRRFWVVASKSTLPCLVFGDCGGLLGK